MRGWLVAVVLRLVALLPSPALAKGPKNEIMKSPVVRCGVDGVVFEMETRKPFGGQLYVQNEFRRPECRAEFGRGGAELGTGEGRGPKAQSSGGVFRLHFNECGMRRQRLLDPKGMAYSTTMVVQFHPTFVTAEDRAYQIRCFYREHNMGVSAEQMNISPLTTLLMEVSHPVPKCGYSIRHKSMDGPAATQVRVGDPVVHLFKCDSDDSMYRMLIRDCYVDDGKENRQQIIDEHGCTLDEDIVETPEYTEAQLVVFAEATVFKWPDEASVYFSCQLSLCARDDPACLKTSPPDCGSRRRRRRASHHRPVSKGIFPLASSANKSRHTDDKAQPLSQLQLDLEVRRLVVLDLEPLNDHTLTDQIDPKPFLFSPKTTLATTTATTPTTSETVEVTSATDPTLLMWMDHPASTRPTPTKTEKLWTQATTVTSTSPESTTTAERPSKLRKKPSLPMFADIPMVADLRIEPEVAAPGDSADSSQMRDYGDWADSELLRLAELGRLAETAEEERTALEAQLGLLAPPPAPPPSPAPFPQTPPPAASWFPLPKTPAAPLTTTPRAPEPGPAAVYPGAWRPVPRTPPPMTRGEQSSSQREFLEERRSDSVATPLGERCYSAELVLGLGVVVGCLGLIVVAGAFRLIWPALRCRQSYSTGLRASPTASAYPPYYAASIISNPISCQDSP